MRAGGELPAEVIRDLGENHPGEFFRLIVEPLNDSFDAGQVAVYERLMTAWLQPETRVSPAIPPIVEAVYVLSRVTLGADVKITSIILDAMKQRFPGARLLFVANRKSAELFAADPAVEILEADYPRAGGVSRRIAFGEELRGRLDEPHAIVVDPDSRLTQLGLVPVCEPQRYFHFRSRTADSTENLTDLTRQWVEATFGVTGKAYIAPVQTVLEDGGPLAAVSFGVGGNDTKRISAEFEAGLIRDLASRYRTVWIDRGAGGEEAARVTAAVEASGTGEQIRFWEGSFAGFASIIQQSNFYAGYDSAGQHVADACGVPLTSYFVGAPSARFEARWRPLRNVRPTIGI